MTTTTTATAWTAEDREFFRQLFATTTAPTTYRCTWCGNTDAARPNSICTRRACIERH